MTLLDENKICVSFAASDVKKIPPIASDLVDTCFLLESIEEMHKKVESLMAIKQQLTDLNSAVSNLTQKSLQFVICQPVQGTQSVCMLLQFRLVLIENILYRANKVL